MEVQLTSDQQAFVRHAVETGRLRRKRRYEKRWRCGKDANASGSSLWPRLMMRARPFHEAKAA